MKFNKIKITVLLLASLLLFTNNIEAQRQDDVTSILTKFKNYRFGAVNVYKITTPNELKEIIEEKRKSATATDSEIDEEECMDEVDETIKSIIRNGILDGNSKSEIQRQIILDGYTPPQSSTFECVYDVIYAQEISQGPETQPKAYLVTSRPNKGELPDRIIGLIYMELPFEDASQPIKDDLSFVAPDDVFSYNRLKDTKLDPAKYGYSNMYDLAYAYLVQGNIENETMAARGIGTDVIYFDKEYGVSTALIKDNRVSSRDIQTYKRISEGMPEEYIGKDNIIVASPDLISWTKYQMLYERNRRGETAVDSLGNKIVNQSVAPNEILPEFGIELKYGIEGVNYPSFWSNRMTVSALWKNVKFGIIAPTDGWASFSEDIYDVQRTMTTGGVGVAGELDFPFVVIPRSDVFRVSFGYIFGDAEPGPFNGNFDPDPLDPTSFNSLSNDYLMRYNFQMHYTFGISIDSDYYMRFGVGGTGYSMEHWAYQLNNDSQTPEVNFVENRSEFVGGISGILEFMTTNNTTPFGGGIQYFDESLSFNGWLQIPVVENTFSVRLEANGYAEVFRSETRPWERGSIFIPMARLIYIF